MGSKIDAASSAVAPGSNCKACVIASGKDLNSIRSILGDDKSHKQKGTLFCSPGSSLEQTALLEFNAAKVCIAMARLPHCEFHLPHFLLSYSRLLAQMHQRKLANRLSLHEQKPANCKQCPTRRGKISSMLLPMP